MDNFFQHNEKFRDEKFKINLKIAEQQYPLICCRKDEKVYRDAAAAVNDKILRYRSRFPAKSLLEYTTMSAIHIASEYEAIKDIRDKSEVFDRLEALTGEIEEFISNNINDSNLHNNKKII
jgi:cell division protein ZapA (FtsZ GTPase activity inhibitor)